ncbi:MAG: TIGR04255 family protein [Chloroflexi bacterium]|nr:TIGR04255 family protein [Chloroflexota bacterium]
MPFPITERVSYKHTPLVQVICQLRFPTILKVEAGLPVDFQERVRHEFPIFQEKQLQTAYQLSAGLKDVLPPEFRGLLPQESGYNFISADEKWMIGLTKDFLSLSTSSYSRWEEFSNRLRGPLDSLKQVYPPSFFTRIGLRYQNLIRRSELGLTDTAWSDLIQPHLAGILSNNDVGPYVQDSQQVITIELRENFGKVRIRHGLAKVEDTGETAYLIDSDFFIEQRTETGNEAIILDQYHRRAGYLFRWCIRPQLHDAMEPTSISGNNN